MYMKFADYLTVMMVKNYGIYSILRYGGNVFALDRSVTGVLLSLVYATRINSTTFCNEYRFFVRSSDYFCADKNRCYEIGLPHFLPPASSRLPILKAGFFLSANST